MGLRTLDRSRRGREVIASRPRSLGSDAAIASGAPSDSEDDFEIAAPAWRVRRFRAHLGAVGKSGAAARASGEPREAPADLAHRAEALRWLSGWDRAGLASALATPKPPTERQLAKLARWQAGAGRLRPGRGAERREIIEAVADELLSALPLKHGAIAAAHRETVRRCRDAGLPGPKASRYRKWLKLTGRAPA